MFFKKRIQLRQLAKEGKYDEIRFRYGIKAYEKYTPNKIYFKEKQQLIDQGKFFEVYEKFGQKQYKTSMSMLMYKDILQETSNKHKAKLYSNWYTFSRILAMILIVFLIRSQLNILLIFTSIKFEEERYNTYLTNIEEYSNNITMICNENNFSDLDIFMKLFSDMWKNSRGYKENRTEIIGCLGEVMGTKDGYGICRNMADDIARKLNLINPQYNARVFAVYIDTGRIETVSIYRNIIQNVNQESNKTKNIFNNIDEFIGSFCKYITGNHALVAVDIKSLNITLIVDPTQLFIGMYKNGTITIFNPIEGGKTPTIYRTSFSEESYWQTNELIQLCDFTSSFLKNDIAYDELEKMYGIDAQKRSLEKVSKY